MSIDLCPSWDSPGQVSSRSHWIYVQLIHWLKSLKGDFHGGFIKGEDRTWNCVRLILCSSNRQMRVNQDEHVIKNRWWIKTAASLIFLQLHKRTNCFLLCTDTSDFSFFTCSDTNEASASSWDTDLKSHLTTQINTFTLTIWAQILRFIDLLKVFSLCDTDSAAVWSINNEFKGEFYLRVEQLVSSNTRIEKLEKNHETAEKRLKRLPVWPRQNKRREQQSTVISLLQLVFRLI